MDKSEHNNHKKRNILLVIGGILLVVAVCGGYQLLRMKKDQKAIDALQITFTKDTTLEYGSVVAADTLVRSHSGKLIDLPVVNTKQLGEQELLYYVSQDTYKKEARLRVTVTDSKPASIQLKEDKLVIQEQPSYDINTNVIAVSDPVDGALTYQKAKTTEKGCYYIESELKSNQVGTYSAVVHAMDKNGNTSKKTFTIHVEKASANVGSKDGKAGTSSIKIQPTYRKGILLVNRSYPIPKTFGGTDQTANAALQKLQQGAKKAGHAMPLISGYRSYDYQSELYNAYVARDGRAAADRYSARPGTSEHQTGLAFDVGAIDNDYGETAAGKWLAAHCAEYGFILRYQQGKEVIKGYMYEPWHIRYVGYEHAQAITASKLTLEEYLGV